MKNNQDIISKRIAYFSWMVRSLLCLCLFAASFINMPTVYADNQTPTDNQADASVEPDAYTDFDKQNALIMCMTVEYVKSYQQDPAPQDIMPLCNARFQMLQQTLPYFSFKKVFWETTYTPTLDADSIKIQTIYNNIMLGIPY